MGRKPLNLQRPHLNLDPDDLARVTAMVRIKGISKFVRNAVRQQLDQIAPGNEPAGPPFFEINGMHEPRLSASGRAAVFEILRRKKSSLDQLQIAFGMNDTIKFIHALLGHRSLPDQATAAVATRLLGKLYNRG